MTPVHTNTHYMFTSDTPVHTEIHMRITHTVGVPLDTHTCTLHAYVCMGNLYRYIVACGHLGNSTGHRTATLVAPLLLTSGPVRYAAVLHSCGTSPVQGQIPSL